MKTINRQHLKASIVTLDQVKALNAVKLPTTTKKRTTKKKPTRMTKKNRLEVIRREFLPYVYEAGLNITTIRKFTVEKLQSIVRICCTLEQFPVEEKEFYINELRYNLF